MNKKILVCESRNLSYGSSGFILREIRAALEERGIEVVYFHLEEDQSNLDALEDFTNDSFDAVLDINSHLPLVIMEDGTYLLDHIDAPFFNYIVDHPLHLHPILSSPLHNHHIICLDPEHRSYVERYYPNICSCYALPIAGSIAKSITLSKAEADRPFGERSWQLYFPGTYVPLSEYEAKLKKRNPKLLSLAQEYLRIAGTEEHIAIPDWIQSVMPEEYPPFSDAKGENFSVAEKLHLDCRYIDRYVRETYRHRMIEKILTAGISIHVTGAYWEYYEGRGAKNLCIHPACTYPEMLDHMSDSQIVLNVQPLFVYAPHDRILCAMANGAVVFTDSCGYLQEHLKAGKEYISYDIHAANAGLKMLKKMLKNPAALEDMAAAGQAFVNRHFLWPDWCEQFVEMIDKEKGKR